MMSHANVLDPSSGILPLGACAEAWPVQAVTLKPSPTDSAALRRHRLVHANDANLVAELVEKRHVAGRPVHDLERIGIGPDARQPVGYADGAGGVLGRAVLETGDIGLIGLLAGGREGQLAAA